ncbi:MAG: hypothetical protein ACRDRH_25175 [Pseudonocardia sp.]
MTRGSTQPHRHRMRKQARRDSARYWITSGARVTVKTYAKWYGVDRYTAYDDLLAIGFPLTPEDAFWAVRPPAVPNQPPAEPEPDGSEWIWIGDQRTFVLGYTAGGAPFGYVEGLDDRHAYPDDDRC